MGDVFCGLFDDEVYDKFVLVYLGYIFGCFV